MHQTSFRAQPKPEADVLGEIVGPSEALRWADHSAVHDCLRGVPPSPSRSGFVVRRISQAQPSLEVLVTWM